VDGRTLIRLWLTGELGLEGQSFQLGGLVTSRLDLNATLKECAQAAGLSCEIRAVDGVPRRVMAKAKGGGGWSDPHLAITLYDDGEEGWSPRRTSLLRDRAQYSMATYRKSVPALPASIGDKIGFFIRHPRLGMSIALAALGLSDRLDRLIVRLRRRGKLPKVL